ncbi:MAG TPA: FAD-binding protein [Cyclobacteriaceae bacterium]|nr:FAD-binding protein [Cyclobacteriaceae bacterium]
MTLKDRLPVSYLLFTTRGRIDRVTYWTVSLFIWTSFYVLFSVLDLISYTATLVLYPILFWALIATGAKRLHDSDRSGWWLLIALIPVAGPLALIFLLGFRKGKVLQNSYGAVPGSAPDYFKNPDGETTPHLKPDERIINDVTQLNPIVVAKVVVPTSIEELQDIIRTSTQPICIGGGRFSMGGQTASPQCVHIDMRKLNKIIEFSATEKTIKVQAGIRWCDIQEHVDQYDLGVKIMQTYANFTVGGALSVNCHGRYIGLGPLILSVRSLDVVMANGDLVHTSPAEKPEIFFACVGCYNAVAVIANVEFDLADNVPVKRSFKKMKSTSYADYFKKNIRDNPEVVFHNGDIYPPKYKNIRAVSWNKTTEKPTVKTRLMPLAASYPLERYFIGAFARNAFGKWRREFIIDPLLYVSKKVHWRNYEAGYDVLELEPHSRKKNTYVLQEYFVAVEKFDAFMELMPEIFRRHNVNVINVSIRHALADNGSLLAWARQEVFAFVVWYRQGTTDADKTAVGVWTREMIDAVLSVGGSYYLPYQPHATSEQFHKAYPGAMKLFELKKKLDPDFKFRNVIWDTYYKHN